MIDGIFVLRLIDLEIEFFQDFCGNLEFPVLFQDCHRRNLHRLHIPDVWVSVPSFF